MERRSFENLALDDSLGTGLLNKAHIESSLNASEINLGINDTDNDVSVIENLKRLSLNQKNTLLNIELIGLSHDCTNGTSSVSSSALNEILKYDLKDYLKERLVEQYSFCSRVSVEDIMKWQSKEITASLTKIPIEFERISLQLFKNLLSYMTDRKSNKKVVEHAKKHIKITMTSSEEIKDEAYVQVLKQIKDHKDPQKAIKGWNFFAIIASCYVPSTKLFYSILNFLLFEIKNNEDQLIKHHANYVFVRLYKTFENKRKNIPSDNEILHIENMKPISFPVHFFSDTSSNANIESYTTMNDLKTLIMKKLQFNVNRIPYYSLYEICQKKNNLEERFLEDNERVCDVLSLWQSDIEDNLKKKEQIEFKIYLKIFLYYPYSETDVDTITALYSQSVFDVTNGKFNLNEQDIITLAALQLLVEFSTTQDNAYQSLQKKLEKYVPNDKINLNPSVYWVQKIMELYSGLKSSSKLEAKLTYIEQLKASPLWEAHQFVTKYTSKNVENSENLPDDIIVGIKPDGISIFDLEKNELCNYPYHVIANWGISSNFFVIIISKSEGQVVKHYFENSSTKIIQAMLESYTNLIAGKSITEVQVITSDYGKRFQSLNTTRIRSGSMTSKNKS